MPNYKEIEKLIVERKPFNHSNSMSAVVTDERYEIFSYRTLIATFTYDTCEWWLNENKYSVTTSKQQSLIRRATGVRTTLPNTPQFPN